LLALAAILCSEANVLVMCTTRDGTDHSCEVWLKSHQLFDLWRLDKIFQFLALAAILCSEMEHAGVIHN
jgi:hypothetical protein